MVEALCSCGKEAKHLKPLLDDCPCFYEGNTVLNALDNDFGAHGKRRIPDGVSRNAKLFTGMLVGDLAAAFLGDLFRHHRKLALYFVLIMWCGTFPERPAKKENSHSRRCCHAACCGDE